MKDPFQSKPTPYEVLGVEPDADNKAIDKALGEALKKGNAGPANKARLTLMRPKDRGGVDLLFYHGPTLKRLAPSPAGDPFALGAERRAATAKAWEEALKKDLNDQGAIHSLAVLWYWWAMREEEGAGEGGTEAVGGPPRPDLWKRAIGYWGMLSAQPDFWERYVYGPEVKAEELEKGFFLELKTRLRELATSRNGAAGEYGFLELAAGVEVRAARLLKESGLRTAQGKLACGPLALEHLGLLARVRKQIEEACAKEPAKDIFKQVRIALSPYSLIHSLLEQRRPGLALEKIAALPPRERSSDEARDLEAKARLLLGREQATLGKYEDALDSWGEALKCNPGHERVGEIRKVVVDTCHDRAVAIRGTEPDEAIALLELAIEVVPEERLKVLLGELLKERGWRRINLASKREAGTEEERRALVAEFQGGFEDIERAAGLGAPEGKEDLEKARQRIEDEKAWIGVPRKAWELNIKAVELGDERWEEALRLTREAIEIVKQAGVTVPSILYRNVSVILRNRAIVLLNDFIGAYNRECEAFLSKFIGGRGHNLDLLSNIRGLNFCCHCGNTNTAYTLTISGGKVLHLCAGCSSEHDRLVERGNRYPPPALKYLREAREALWEALAVAPEDKKARAALDSLQDQMARFGIPGEAPPRRRSRPSPKEAGVPEPAKASGANKRLSLVYALLALLLIAIVGLRSFLARGAEPFQEPSLMMNGKGGASDAAKAPEPAGPSPALLDPRLARDVAPPAFCVRFRTTKGEIVVEVDRSWSFAGADRLYNLARIGFFKGVCFHRVVRNSGVQFGIHGDTGVSRAWASAAVSDEKPVGRNERGTFFFARASGPGARTTQFFINLRDNPALDGLGYAPLGRVVEGMEVAEKLHAGYGEVPPAGKGPNPGSIEKHGNGYLQELYPELDRILGAEVEPIPTDRSARRR